MAWVQIESRDCACPIPYSIGLASRHGAGRRPATKKKEEEEKKKKKKEKYN